MKKILIALLFTTSAMAQEFTPLYSHGIPNYKEVVNKQSAAKGADGIERISKVSVPTYRFFPASSGKDLKSCVVICPGGGFILPFTGGFGSSSEEICAITGCASCSSSCS
jgi:hypothetical protein